MHFNYTVTSIRIPSRWFDIPQQKRNTFQKMGGYKGFNLYLQLYKFRLHAQEKEHTFVTSIALLRKETGYTAEAVFDLLKSLKSAKIITITGVSRWEYLLDKNKKPLEDKLLHITVQDEECNPIHSFDKELDDYYIYISFDLMKRYKETGLDEKHFALHCLVQRLQHGKGVCYMAIEKMSEVLDIDKDTIHRMIFNLNRNYFMVSIRKSNASKRGEGSYRYEHITFENNNKYADDKTSHWDGWLSKYKEEMDKIATRADKRKERKSRQRNKSKIKKAEVLGKQEQTEIVHKEVPLVFGKVDVPVDSDSRFHLETLF